MSVYHKPVKRKLTGGKKKRFCKKKKRHIGRFPTETRLVSEDQKELRKKIRVKGGGIKIRLYRARWANVYDPENKKFQKVKIIDVLENKANREYKRRSVITKGAIILTEIGEAKVTSRPGQCGVINAVLIKKSEK